MALSGALLLQGVWDLPRSRTEPVSPALAGRFFTTKAAGKPRWSLIPGNPTPSQARFLLLCPLAGMCVVCERPSHQAQPTKVGLLPWRGPTVQRNSVNSPWGEESGGPGLSSTVRVGAFPRPGLSALKAPPVSSPSPPQSPPDQATIPASSKPFNFSLLTGCKG